MSSNATSPIQIPLKSGDEAESFLKFTNGTLVHPELLLLSVSLLRNKQTHEAGFTSIDDSEG